MESHSLTLDEACAFLQISRPTATNWIRSGRLQATRKDPAKPKSPYTKEGNRPDGSKTPTVRKMRVDDQRAWNAACRRAGIEDFRFHDLRHTWASWLIQSGVPLSVLQEMGGWESIEMVRRYAHLAPNHLTEHAKQIDSIFSDDVPNMSHLENKELAENG